MTDAVSGNPLRGMWWGLAFIGTAGAVFRVLESPLAMTPEAWAAWAQAVLSALAVLMAVWLQDRQRAKERGDRAIVALEALMFIAHQARLVVQDAREQSLGQSWTPLGVLRVRDGFQTVLRDLETMPFVALPNRLARLDRWVMHTASSTGLRMLREVDDLLVMKGQPPKDLFDIIDRQVCDVWTRLERTLPARQLLS